MSITIREKDSGTALAEADEGPSLAKYEGNWYFDPAAVRSDVLRVTERTYTCPYKGTCNWVDFVGSDGRTVKDVGALRLLRRQPGRDDRSEMTGRSRPSRLDT
jgi:uncharacterized protein (DUF427 family)